MDLSDAEANLLAENLSFTDGTHVNDVEYSYLLLLLFEPIHKTPLVEGKMLMKKMLRGSDSVALRRLLSLLFRNFAATDPRATGLSAFAEAESELRKECPNMDLNALNILLRAFQDKSSDCVFYPELLSFLSCCSLWNVMYRKHYLNQIRLKQGYDLTSYLKKFDGKKKAVDKTKALEIFHGLGMLCTDTSMSIMFTAYSGDKDKTGKPQGKLMDMTLFTDGLNKASGDDDNENNYERKDVGSYNYDGGGNDGICEITESILKKYDDDVVKAVQQVFDIFDIDHTGRVPTYELERLLCSLGRTPDPLDIEVLARDIDRRSEGEMEYNRFMDKIVPYLRKQYDEKASPMTQVKLKKLFDGLDHDKSGELSSSEVEYMLRSTTAAITTDEVEAFIDFLDVDGDKSLSWTEFARVFTFIKDKSHINSLDYDVRSAIRKLEFASIPDPYKHLGMFSNLPTNFRLSTLAYIAKRPESMLHEMVTPSGIAELTSHIGDINCQVTITGVSGVPCVAADSPRAADVVGRAVHFCICKSETPPNEDSGCNPIFLGNVATLRAYADPKYPDAWTFSSKSQTEDGKGSILDSKGKCFIKATYPNYQPKTPTSVVNTTTAGSGSNTQGKVSGREDVPVDQLYLFVELVTTMRVRPVAGSVSRKRGRGRGIDRVRDQRDRDRSESPDKSPDGRGGDDDFNDSNHNITSGDGDDNDDYIAASAHDPVVEMSTGWTLIPLSMKDGYKTDKNKYKVFGGTPYIPMGIRKKEVMSRKGVYNAILGAGKESIVTCEVTQDIRKLHSNALDLCEALPDNIVLPKGGIVAIALFRRLLRQEKQLTSSLSSDRILPQTGSLRSVDPLFGVMPRILQDEAACRTFMAVWKKLCPAAVLTNTGMIMKPAEAMLRSVVMLVYRSMAQPTAKRNSMVADESEEEVQVRMVAMMNVIVNSGILTQLTDTKVATGGGTFGFGFSGTLPLPLSGTDTTTSDENKVLYSDLTEYNTPFNPRELVWDPEIL